MNDERGQSTIEFALTLVLILIFTFFFAQLSLVLGIGNYVQYATFMASRAYLSAGQTETDQRTRACIVIANMLTKGGASGGSGASSSCAPGGDKYPTVLKGDVDSGNDMDMRGLSLGKPSYYDAGNRHLSWLEGVRYTFKSRVFFLPFSGMAEREPAAGTGAVSGLKPNEIRLTSESWLMREPSYDECRGQVEGNLRGFFDNGC